MESFKELKIFSEKLFPFDFCCLNVFLVIPALSSHLSHVPTLWCKIMMLHSDPAPSRSYFNTLQRRLNRNFFARLRGNSWTPKSFNTEYAAGLYVTYCGGWQGTLWIDGVRLTLNAAADFTCNGSGFGRKKCATRYDRTSSVCLRCRFISS